MGITDSGSMTIKFRLNFTGHWQNRLSMLQHPSKMYQRAREVDGGAFRSSGSTRCGSCATSPDVAVRNWATRPGSIALIVLKSSAAGWDNWLVHILPNTCSPLAKMFLTKVSLSLAVSSKSLIMASARLDGMKYVLLPGRPCLLASKSCRDRLALGAARASPPGVCCASPVHRISGYCLSRLTVAISRSVPYC